MAKREVIAIIGTTGVGKTQLAIDLANAIRTNAPSAIADGLQWPKTAEIINADSMQVYRGLDIITNKATTEERNAVPHHLMDILEPGEEYRVDCFRRDAMAAIDDIHARGGLPIIVGGTMYFLQHLLFPGKLVSADKTDNVETSTGQIIKGLDDLSPEQRNRLGTLPEEAQKLLFALEDLPSLSTPDAFPPKFPVWKLSDRLQAPEAYTDTVYQILRAIDPDMAGRWHWRDIRKTTRSVQVFLQSGKTHSSIIREQSKAVQETQYRTLIFWPFAEYEKLDPRLDARVEIMCQRGLLEEVQQLRELARLHEHLDLSKGIYQSIGYKDFAAYLDAKGASPDDAAGNKSQYEAAIEATKLGTRQYARRQVKFIRNQLLPLLYSLQDVQDESSEALLYLLDAGDLSAWSAKTARPAEFIMSAFVTRRSLPHPCSLSDLASNLLGEKVETKNIDNHAKIQCDICTIDEARPFLLDGEQQMEAHKRSRAHRKRLQKNGGRQKTNDPQG